MVVLPIVSTSYSSINLSLLLFVMELQNQGLSRITVIYLKPPVILMSIYIHKIEQSWERDVIENNTCNLCDNSYKGKLFVCLFFFLILSLKPEVRSYAGDSSSSMPSPYSQKQTENLWDDRLTKQNKTKPKVSESMHELIEQKNIPSLLGWSFMLWKLWQKESMSISIEALKTFVVTSYL